MWPSVPSFRPFGDIACPSGAQCELPYCLFSHNANKLERERPLGITTKASFAGGPDAKRLKLDDGAKEPSPQVTRVSRQMAPPPVIVGSIETSPPAYSHSLPQETSISRKISHSLPRSATKAISPPPKAAEVAVKAIPEPEVEVRLTPRKLAKEPAGFTTRLKFLKALHQYLSSLNHKISTATDIDVKAVHMSANQLNRMAVTEEENIAKEHGPVYENVLKQRLVQLKKMDPRDFAETMKAAAAKERGEEPERAAPKSVHTGLTAKEEVIVLEKLITGQAGLDKYGYVTKQHSAAELDEARKVVETNRSYEACARCNTRFQVFPDRREEDGALTTGGKCTAHWGRRVYPKKPARPTWSCCDNLVGSPGCTLYDTHVFKTGDTKRLSLILPFIQTPENQQVEPQTAVCFDCEMGYTTHGMELVRLTAAAWPTYKPLVDVLVRPLGHILDLNTRFSGVSLEQYLDAKPYDPSVEMSPTPVIPIVDSPQAARKLLLSCISPSTPLIGHALENDLNAVRIIHPKIVDTMMLYPHPQGLPRRLGLKDLSKRHLGINIQQAGSAGHDSFEDARAAGELARIRVAEKWSGMKKDGWEFRNGGVYPPLSTGTMPRAAPTAPTMIRTADTSVTVKPTLKRMREEDSESVGDEPPLKKRE
ncbi:RNA exonuclease 3 [Massariosphaeria phaeospora]|uniref:RNA exonuclease 3 n=1 Tax=Massariosphaeria phaeospora TaxID=100035 RepID=A0A7C8LZW8_9PLEO|nr:RNA exonuclease 3 [Massariosphaeria phaeospora]